MSMTKISLILLTINVTLISPTCISNQCHISKQHRRWQEKQRYRERGHYCQKNEHV